MTSTRAEEVAEILWELKQADKVATFSTIARRAGFSAGSNGRAMLTALRTVRRDWPHLQWWRAVRDDGTLDKDSEHVGKLHELGLDCEPVDGNDEQVSITALDDRLMSWEAPEQADGDEQSSDE